LTCQQVRLDPLLAGVFYSYGVNGITSSPALLPALHCEATAEDLSQFARDQGEKWYDHDFMEHGYKKNVKSVEDLVNGYSYFEQWSAELARRAAEAGLTNANMLVFISKDQIDKPQSVEGDGYSLRYLGTIKYRI
jgi:hypothetical protein